MAFKFTWFTYMYGKTGWSWKGQEDNNSKEGYEYNIITMLQCRSKILVIKSVHDITMQKAEIKF
jgi:hypothetical protein